MATVRDSVSNKSFGSERTPGGALMATHVNIEDSRYANTPSSRTCEMNAALGDWRGEQLTEG